MVSGQGRIIYSLIRTWNSEKQFPNGKMNAGWIAFNLLFIITFYKIYHLKDVVRTDYINLCHHRKLITQPTNKGLKKLPSVRKQLTHDHLHAHRLRLGSSRLQQTP